MSFERTYDEGLILKRMNQWRGALALVVLLSHLWGYTGIAFLVPFNKLVTIAVFLFFFLSGCGMTRSRSRKAGYVSSIYTVKIPRLMFIALMAYLAAAVLQALLRVPVDGECRFIPVGPAAFFATTNWYVYELIAFYVLFSLTGNLRGPGRSWPSWPRRPPWALSRSITPDWWRPTTTASSGS